MTERNAATLAPLMQAIDEHGVDVAQAWLEARDIQISLVYGPMRGFDAWMWSVTLYAANSCTRLHDKPFAAETLTKALAIALVESHGEQVTAWQLASG